MPRFFGIKVPLLTVAANSALWPTCSRNAEQLSGEKANSKVVGGLLKKPPSNSPQKILGRYDFVMQISVVPSNERYTPVRLRGMTLLMNEYRASKS